MYGEADLKLQAWFVLLPQTPLALCKPCHRCEKVSTPDNPGLLMTIDSDAVAIAMCNDAPVTVELARIWQDKAGKQYYSSG